MSDAKQGRKLADVYPTWCRKQFVNCLLDVQRLSQVLHLSQRGIAGQRAQPEIVEFLAEMDPQSAAGRPGEIERARDHANLAKREVDEDFPVLHAWGVVGLWAHLESLIRNLGSAWLSKTPAAWKIDQVCKIRVRIGDYEAVPRSERPLYVVKLLEQDLGSGFRSGVERFESMLDVFGLSGNVHENIRRVIYELGRVRNLIAHSFLNIDRQFKRDCPWIKQKIGTRLRITSKMFAIYSHASILYVNTVYFRIGERFGWDYSLKQRDNEEAAATLLRPLRPQSRRKRTLT